MFYVLEEEAIKITAKYEFKSRKCEFSCEERTGKKDQNLQLRESKQRLLQAHATSRSGANENAGTRVNPGLVNRLTNRGFRNAF